MNIQNKQHDEKFSFNDSVFFTFTTLGSQDVIVTTENKFLDVEIVSIDAIMTFFKEKDESEVKKISNRFVKAIQWNSKKSELQNLQIRKAQIESDMLVNNFTILENDNDEAVAAAVISAVFCFGAITQVKAFADELCVFWQFDFNVERIYFPLGFSAVSAFVAIIVRPKNKFELKSHKELGLSDNIYELRSQPLKNQIKSSYLGVANSGLGIQLNF